MQYMENTTHLHDLQMNSDWYSISKSTPDEIDHSIFSKELKHGIVKVAEWYAPVCLSYGVGCEYHMRSNLAEGGVEYRAVVVAPIIYLNWLYVDGTAQYNIEALDRFGWIRKSK